MLPQELCDLIMGFCHNDLEALRACSLASQALHRSTKPYIFHSITIDSMDILNRFYLLLQASPDVARDVRELHFNTYRHFMRKEPFIWIHFSSTAFPAGTFKRLKVIEFSYVRFDHLASIPVMHAFQQDLTNYRGIQELRISSCDFENMGALKDFISRFAPQSQTHPLPFMLSLDCVRWGGLVPTEQIAPSDTGPCLSSLTVVNYSKPDIISAWLLSTPSAGALRSVNLKCVMGQELTGVGEFLRSLGTALEHLQLGLRLDNTPQLIEEVWHIFDLSRNTELRSLHLRILDLDPHHMRWIPALLLQVAHVSLQSVTFDIWLHNPAQLVSPAWVDIESSLSSNPFKTVQAVLFIHHGVLHFADARAALEKRLPALAKRRVLRVRDCSKPLHSFY